MATSVAGALIRFSLSLLFASPTAFAWNSDESLSECVLEKQQPPYQPQQHQHQLLQEQQVHKPQKEIKQLQQQQRRQRQKPEQHAEREFDVTLVTHATLDKVFYLAETVTRW
jgi:hypothetical protein